MRTGIIAPVRRLTEVGDIVEAQCQTPAQPFIVGFLAEQVFEDRPDPLESGEGVLHGPDLLRNASDNGVRPCELFATGRGVVRAVGECRRHLAIKLQCGLEESLPEVLELGLLEEDILTGPRVIGLDRLAGQGVPRPRRFSALCSLALAATRLRLDVFSARFARCWSTTTAASAARLTVAAAAATPVIPAIQRLRRHHRQSRSTGPTGRARIGLSARYRRRSSASSDAVW